MENIEGDPLFDRLEKFTVPRQQQEQLPSTFINKLFLMSFFTFYILTLLAIKGYSHGDPHARNIMLSHHNGKHFFLNELGGSLTICNMNVVPYIIDFGRAAAIINLGVKIVNADIEFLAVCPVSQFYMEKYNYLVTSQESIDQIIKGLLSTTQYVEAILILTMCCSHIDSDAESMFEIANRNRSTAYNHLFTITSEQALLLNAEISIAISDRKTLEAQLQQPQYQDQQTLQYQIDNIGYVALSNIHLDLHRWYIEYLIDYYTSIDETQQEIMLKSIHSIDINIYEQLLQLIKQYNQLVINIDNYVYEPLSNINPSLHKWYILYLYMKYKSYNIKEQEYMRNNIDHTLWGKLVKMMMHTTGGRYRYTKHRKKNQKKINKTQKPKKSKKLKKLKKIRKIKTRKL
jgi:hypothetical protein